MELNARRKDIVKNIAIIFLIIMLVLTFFSSTIMNRSLPQVAAQYAYSGQITTSVRANGVTSANENYQVILEEGRIIHTVHVRRGDKVQAGDLLFTLEDGDSTELQNAQDAVAKAELDYEKWKLQTQSKIADAERQIRYQTEDLTKIKNRGVASSVNTTEQEKRIRDLEKELGIYQRAEAEMIFRAADTALDAAEAALDAATDDYEQKSERYHELKNNGSSAAAEQLRQQLLSAERDIEDKTVELTRLKQTVAELQTSLDALLANRTQLKRRYDSAQSVYGSYLGEETVIRSNIAAFQGKIDRLSSLSSLTEAEERELAEARGSLSYYQSMLSTIATQQSEAQSELNQAEAAYNANESSIKQTEEQLKSLAQTQEDRERILSRAESDCDEIRRKLEALNALPDADADALLKEAQQQMRDAEDVRDDAQEAYSDAQNAYNTAKSAYESAKQNGKATDEVFTEEQLKGLIAGTERELENAREHLKDLQSAGGSGDGYASYNAYQEAITAQQRTIENLKNELARTREEIALEEPTYTEAIARAKQSAARIAETSGSNEIYAKISGTVNNISVSAGQEIKAQTVLAEIEQTNRGYSAELSLTAEQAKRIAVGQSASILYYWGTAPEAVVESIKPSQTDPQNTRIVTLLLTGDITAGQSFTFQLGERAANYDSVVPSSAIREDSNGKFVLIVEAKNTPIGNRYTAVRRDIDVIAQDGTNTAVSGLNGGEFVITTSQTPISAGQQVRLSDT